MSANPCKGCNGQGMVDVYGGKIYCPSCAWPLAKCHCADCKEENEDAV